MRIRLLLILLVFNVNDLLLHSVQHRRSDIYHYSMPICSDFYRSRHIESHPNPVRVSGQHGRVLKRYAQSCTCVSVPCSS